jgi:hypothetical protein
MLRHDLDREAWHQRVKEGLEQELREERRALLRQIDRLKQEGKEQMEEVMEQLTAALSVSDLESAPEDMQPADLIVLLAERQSQSAQRVSKLADQLRHQEKEKEAQLAALQRAFHSEKKQEQDKVINFVMRLEERDQNVLREAARAMETTQICDVIRRLFDEHNIRLMGVDCGLSFLLEAPLAQWVSVAERELLLQQVCHALAELLPDDFRRTASWSDVGEIGDDVDIQLGKPLTTQEQGESHNL